MAAVAGLGMTLLVAPAGPAVAAPAAEPAAPAPTAAKAAPAAATVKAPRPACAPAAADVKAATSVAAACGSRVEVTSARSEYTQVFVEPSGVHTFESSVTPQRVRKADGNWTGIDTTLSATAEGIRPRATTADVTFSAGGSAPLISLRQDGHTFTLSWPDRLPKPVVSGSRATYPEVQPGVDLVVNATRVGFSHVLVVKTPEAAADPGLRAVRYRMGGDGRARTDANGALRVTAGDSLLAVADGATMWDSGAAETVTGTESVSARTATAAADTGESSTASAPTPAADVAMVGTRVDGGDLVLTPDAAALAHRGAKFPIYIDPDFATGHSRWTYANNSNVNWTLRDNTIKSGDPNPAASQVWAGYDPAFFRLYRGFMEFPVTGGGHDIRGKQIISAKITGRTDHTWKCTDNRNNYVYRTAGIGATPRQNWPGPALQVLLGSFAVHANEASCNEANMYWEVGGGTITSDVQTAANQWWGSYTIGISAGSDTGGSGEYTQDRWMRHFTDDFRFVVSYNTPPNTPDTLTVDGKPCVAGSGRPFISTATPTLRARVTDNDGDAMQVWYTYAKWNGSSFVDVSSNFQNSVPNGGTAVFPLSGLQDGGIYTWRAQSNDGRGISPITHSPGNCEWQVDLSNPAATTVTGSVYKEGSVGCPAQGCGSVGQSEKFTFASSSDVVSYKWGFSYPPQTTVNAPSVGAQVTVDWAPTAGGAHSLWVQATDRAGRFSEKRYDFVVAAPSPALARWRLNDPAGSTVLFDDTGNGRDATLEAGTLGEPGRLVGGDTAGTFASANAGAAAMVSELNTAASFSASAWVKLSANAGHYAVVAKQSTHASTFMIKYEPVQNKWSFVIAASDVPHPGTWSALGGTPKVGVWTHLAAVYDRPSLGMKLYVNGVLAGTSAAVPLNSSGPVTIGRSFWADTRTNFLPGSIAEVQVWNRTLTASEVSAMADPKLVGRVAEWHFDEVGPGPAFDASPMANDLNFYGGVEIPPAGSGQTGTGLHLDGVDDYVSPDTRVLDTNQSFTISAWVRLSSKTTDKVAVAMNNPTGFSPFYLMYYQEFDRWVAQMPSAEGGTVNWAVARSGASPPLDTWTHLVAVYDATANTLSLWVNGTLAQTVSNAVGFNTAGEFLIGTGANRFWPGDIDEVRVYAGVVANPATIP